MKKIVLLSLIICGLSLSVSGCVKRFSMTEVDQERVDQEISGNKGFISGTIPPDDQQKERVTTRKVYQVTMEVPPYPEWKNFRPSEATSDKEVWGNRGYIYGGPKSAQKTVMDESVAQEEIMLPAENSYKVIEEKEEIVVSKPVKKAAAVSMYKVQQGDTLQKVSKNVYGSSKYWKKIYDFNQDSLKNPNKIYPGQMLKIPE